MRYLHILSLFAFTANVQSALAQRIELGVSVNHLSNGITGIYSHPLGKRFEIGAGLRYMVNTYSLDGFRHGASFYQCGYARTFGEHFGIVFRPAYKIYNNRHWGLSIQASILATNHGLRYKENALMIPSYRIETIRWSMRPAIAVENTIGLRAYCNIDRNWSIQGAAGIGYILMNYYYSGPSLLGFIPTEPVPFDPSLGSPMSVREKTGFNSLPMLYVGVGYNLP